VQINPYDPIDKLKGYAKKYGTDVTIDEQYYNQFTQYMTGSLAIKPYYIADNSRINKTNSKNIFNSSSNDFGIKYFDNVKSIQNFFGAKGTHVGQDIYKKFKPYTNKLQQKAYDGLDYLPVVISTKEQKFLNDGLSKGYFVRRKEHGINTYIMSVRVPFITSDKKTEYPKYRYSVNYNYILLKIGVIDVEYTGIKTNFVTSKPILQRYLKYYHQYKFNNNVINYQKSKTNKIVYNGGDYLEYYSNPNSKKPNYYIQIRVKNKFTQGFFLPLNDH